MTEYRMRLHELIVLYKQIYGDDLEYLRIWQHADLYLQMCSSNHVIFKLDKQLNDLVYLLEAEVRMYEFNVNEHTLEVNIDINSQEFEQLMQDFPMPVSTENEIDFRKTIRSAMKTYKLSGNDLGLALGCNKKYARYDFYRRLRNDTFSRKELYKLMELLHISATDILGTR